MNLAPRRFPARWQQRHPNMPTQSSCQRSLPSLMGRLPRLLSLISNTVQCAAWPQRTTHACTANCARISTVPPAHRHWRLANMLSACYPRRRKPGWWSTYAFALTALPNSAGSAQCLTVRYPWVSNTSMMLPVGWLTSAESNWFTAQGGRPGRRCPIRWENEHEGSRGRCC
jgi:hypothetical protein